MNKIRSICILFILTIAIMSLTACTSGTTTPPALTLTANGEPYTATTTAYCWDGLCVDGIYPPAFEAFVPLSADGQITLTFANPAPDSVFMGLDDYTNFPEVESVATSQLDTVPDTITWTPTAAASEYVLSVSAKWDDGQDAVYHIGITMP